MSRADSSRRGASLKKLAHLAFLATAEGRLSWGLRNPTRALRGVAQLLAEAKPPPLDSLADLTGTSVDRIHRFYLELRRSRLENELQGVETQVGFQVGVHNCIRWREMCYCLVRALRPETFLETGVHHGLTSAYILQGLEDNGTGDLVSIDFRRPGRRLPDGVSYDWPSGRGSGWIIPPRLRNRWTLIEGKTRERLNPALSDLDRIDVFLHDSEHTYENMMFEYRSIWPYLRLGGLLLSDDIRLTDAFFDFASEVNAEYSVFMQRVGGLRKGLT